MAAEASTEGVSQALDSLQLDNNNHKAMPMQPAELPQGDGTDFFEQQPEGALMAPCSFRALAIWHDRAARQ